MVNIQENVAAIILLIMGVGIATIVLIFVGILGGSVYQQTEPDLDVISNNVSNELLNLSYTLLPYIYNTSSDIFETSDTLVAWNGTGTYGTLVRNTNYTVDSYASGQFTISDLGLLNNSFIFVNFSYATGNPVIETQILNAIEESFVALNTTGSYLPIIVLAVIIFIVLGLVMTIPSKRYRLSGRNAVF
jgi:hypothetical protein